LLSASDGALADFGVLGPLRVNGADVVLAAKQRIVLAVLLLHANRVVPVNVLMDALWDEAPPPSARATLQGYVKQLRHKGGAGVGGRVVTRSPGYLLSVGAGELDLDVFTELCDRARSAAAAGEWAGAAALLEEALGLWRGDPLADVPSAWVQQAEVPRLAELRMRAVQARVEADLRLGRHGELVAELRGLVGGEPLREGLHGQLMLALYRCGRQAEALEVFRGIDRQLRAELGVCPGPELQQLHQRILAADPELAGGLRSAVVAQTAGPAPLAGGQRRAGRLVVPAQLPPDTADFTGRGEQVKLLCDLLDRRLDADRPGAVVISAVAGMGGIGKTALAVHVAHRLRERFPDGQVYVSLQGATSPLRPTEVLARLLRDLGEVDETIPAGEEERTARYRSLLAGRTMLIVLDDARDAAQVRPLLPGSAGCAVIVTSRGMLAGLAGAAQLSLDALDDDEARELFTAIIGAKRAAAEPAAAAAVLECCAGLPLAIRIAASRLASRPAWSIEQLAARLASEQSRLAELAAGDLGVRATFAVSYQALATAPAARASAADPARVFRLLGLPGMAELSLPAIAALTGQKPGQVAAALDTLTDVHLLQSPAPDRYRLHDLLRSYAAELAGQIDTQSDQDAALNQILIWFAEQAVAAARALAPGGVFPVIIAVPDTRVAMSAPGQAFAWFETEMAGLIVAARQASGLGRHDITAQIGTAMREFLHRTPYNDAWLAVSQVGVASARRLCDDAVLSSLLVSLGQAHSELNHFADAERCFTEALEIRRRSGDRGGEAVVFNCLAINLCMQGKPGDAYEHMRSALDIMATVDDEHMTGMVLNNMGHILRSVKRYDEALDYLERALVLQQQLGEGFRTGITEVSLGQTSLDLERYEEAARYFRQALASFDGITVDNRHWADALSGLGDALARLGRAGEARQAWLAALPILERLRDPAADNVRRRLAGSA
jgi:DNA-binding SARP family transcriptional activator/predicted negative regulator of RcsB-dependent stress response